jgi:glycosyltransferase involved in cell wall biosynthesis
VEDNTTGLIIPPQNIEALIDAIVQLLLDDSRRKEMGTNARKWIKEHQQSFADIMTTGYQKAIDLHHNRNNSKIFPIKLGGL